MAKEAIVLYPSPAIGHLVSMVELGKHIITHHPSLSIHILLTNQAYDAGATAPYISKISDTTPIVFHHLPKISLPPSAVSSSPRHHETLAFQLLLLNNPNVHQALKSLSNTHKILSLVIDFFCTFALSIADELNIPAYCFFSSSAGCLALMFHMPAIHQNTTKSFRDLKTLIYIPGIPPIPSSDMPKPLLDRDDKAYEFFLDMCIQAPKLCGVIVNTYESLESRTIKTISDGLCVPNEQTPPIFCIGPLIAADNKKGGNDGGGAPEIMAWLDSQPVGSVVFLCFGSLGLFSINQLKEIAIGLEKCGQRFLWVVKSPSPENDKVAIWTPPEQDLSLLLPEGFLDRTQGRGMVVKSWAPQVAVLSHDSVGGFVTHCGWNSILESICAGVPMVAWPLYAEQRMNRALMVEEMKIALPMTESEDGVVSSGEVEKRVRELMESEEGKLIRERTLVLKNEAYDSLSQNGSSRVALSKLVELWQCV